MTFKSAYLTICLSLVFLSCSSSGSALSDDAGDDNQSSESEQINFPFGSHQNAYAEGSIMPNEEAQTQLDDVVKSFYDQWKALYLGSGCGDGRYYVDVNADGKWSGGGAAEDTLTVSEAHGYGMMITVLMAGHDADAQTIFDGMVLYYQDHPAVEDNKLMAWNQVIGCEDAENGGDDTATDGDLDITYALLLADAQWGSLGAVNYLQLAVEMLAQIEASDINAELETILLGNWSSSEEPVYYNGSRSSDWMPGHFRVFAEASNASLWTSVIDVVYTTIEFLQDNFSPDTGLLPDFVINLDESPEPAPENYLEAASDGAYSYNACRDPWRLASDYLLHGDSRAHDVMEKINQWIRTTTEDDPAQIMDGYTLDGVVSEEASFNAMAFVVPLAVAAMTDEANQSWLNQLWNLVTATTLGDEDYFGNTLKMLGLITLTGNFWAP